MIIMQAASLQTLFVLSTSQYRNLYAVTVVRCHSYLMLGDGSSWAFSVWFTVPAWENNFLLSEDIDMSLLPLRPSWL